MFAAWIQERIALYGFVENQDFVVVSDSGNNPKGGRPSRDYHITLDMAKELAMVERNEKGKQARQYFIECERRLLKSTPRSLNPYLKLSS
ncbi:anti-repressor protein [Nitrosospira sp. Nsp1]|nr:anti-repressor protein [Nitrosospira sp. Nsp1]